MHLPPFRHFSAQIPEQETTFKYNNLSRSRDLLTNFGFHFNKQTMQRLQTGQVLRTFARFKHSTPLEVIYDQSPQPPTSTTATPIPNPLAQRSPKTSRLVDEFIRVDHAGELGADQIYAGQMAILGKSRVYKQNV